MMAEPLLEFRAVDKTFVVQQGLLHRSAGEVWAVKDLSLSIFPGETLGLVGESGCGKSTLARMAVRLLAPSAGDILFSGRSVFAKNGKPAFFSRHFQMVFQDPFSSLNPRLRVGTSVAEPLPADVSLSERNELVQKILVRVGLQPEYILRYPHEFSGGQRQRIAIARALITRPKLVVCDEPVSALDASVQAQVLNLLKDVQEEFGLTYLFISHNLSVVGYMSDRVAVMYLGRIVEYAPRDVLFAWAVHPYTRALLASAPGYNPVGRKARTFLSGEMPNPFVPARGCAFHPRCPQVMPRCCEEQPKFVEYGAGHWVRCHMAI